VRQLINDRGGRGGGDDDVSEMRPSRLLCLRFRQWRRQLWATDARAPPPSTYNNFIFGSLLD